MCSPTVNNKHCRCWKWGQPLSLWKTRNPLSLIQPLDLQWPHFCELFCYISYSKKPQLLLNYIISVLCFLSDRHFVGNYGDLLFPFVYRMFEFVMSYVFSDYPSPVEGCMSWAVGEKKKKHLSTTKKLFSLVVSCFEVMLSTMVHTMATYGFIVAL